MDHFIYRENRLFCEQVPLERIAQEVGTPFYCYSEQTLCHHYQVFVQAFASFPHLICFSVKANSNLAVLDALYRQGAGFDIVSGGELARVQRIGCPGERIVFSGVGKSSAEIQAALQYGIRLFNVESLAELRRINHLAGQMGRKAPVALRINPDVDPQTHPHISTGLRRNKFGVPYHQALSLYREAARLPHLELLGLDCHIGSQLTALDPFVDALRRVLLLLNTLEKEGILLRYLDLGGGLGIPYEEGRLPPHPGLYADALLAELSSSSFAARQGSLILEPGRVIAGNAGVLVARVEYIKQGEEKLFIILDAGMNDLIRPALYGAYHTLLPVERRFGQEERVADVVGPICESGDFFAHDRLLPPFQEGDLLAVRSAGAYGFTMSSNYNTRPRVAEVMVRGDRFAVVRQRETIAQILANESLFPVQTAGSTSDRGV
ncbi:diaminopimelate decarboxylase [Candidatus Magnetaquicoccus inordinatus]|uniref:diaminopimelate decarboxylase n=1 Tax=Candidatus Magnetaquicoccus inordinatus TaxID=2496818 RepID=UPI00102CCE66|nr:diaminopimelate decarboxylase [Candidatus Magnetaquicoccus inordinatus]